MQAKYQHCELANNFAKELNIELLFLPSYSPNLNIIERLWKWVKKIVCIANIMKNLGRLKMQ